MRRSPTNAASSSSSRHLLAEHGTPAQRARYLAPLVKGERRCAYAITEAQAGSDVSSIQTRAVETPARAGG